MRGSPASGVRKTRPLAERFAEKWMPEPNTGCWLWLGAIGKGMGYGNISRFVAPFVRRTVLAHRVSYELFVGPIPGGFEVLHGCDTPACVNPDHLTVGPHRQNVLDCVAKGRARGRCSRPETLLRRAA